MPWAKTADAFEIHLVHAVTVRNSETIVMSPQPME
jgi:hypothetical protein